MQVTGAAEHRRERDEHQYRGGVPLFTRDVSVGGNQYTTRQKELT